MAKKLYVSRVFRITAAPVSAAEVLGNEGKKL